jgi:hypothetical protein
MTGRDGGWKCVANGVGLAALLGAMLSWFGVLIAVLTVPTVSSAGDHVLALADLRLVMPAAVAVLLILISSVFMATPGEEPRLLAGVGLALSGLWLLCQGGLFAAAAGIEFNREAMEYPQYVSGEPVGVDLGLGLALLGMAAALLALAYLAWNGFFRVIGSWREVEIGPDSSREVLG